MAGPISHVVYAEKALDTFIPDKDKALFIIGTLFPDSCALKSISREATHFEKVTLRDVQQESDAFKSGVLFHSLIDSVREAYVVRRNAYASLPNSYLSTVALKIREDALLYAKIKNWQPYIDYLQSMPIQAQTYGLSLEKLQQWHTMHRKFLADPSFAKNAAFFSALGFTPEQIATLSDLVAKITSSRIVDTYLDDFYDNLEQHLQR